MIAHTQIGDIYFSFRHEHWDEPRQVSARDSAKAVTYCNMRMDNIIHAEPAFCSVLDNFDKEKGRKVSLARAMDYFNLSKATRRLVWEAYFDRMVPSDTPPMQGWNAPQAAL